LLIRDYDGVDGKRRGDIAHDIVAAP